MTTHMGSLVSELDGYLVRLGIGCKDYEKYKEAFLILFRCTHSAIVDPAGFALLNIATCLPTSLYPLPLTLLA
jgi:hypothetical protein